MRPEAEPIRAPAKRLLEAGSPARRMIVGIARRAVNTLRFQASRLSRRDRRVWAFGNHKGFRDNPRYLAEHVTAEHPDIVAWWVARTEEEADAARRGGLQVAMRGSSTARRVQRRAGVAFLSNAFMDLEAAHLGGAFIVHLYHGTALKRILLDMEPEARPRPSSVAAIAGALGAWWIRRRLAQIDMIAAAGELAHRRFITAFGLPPERIPILGTPRFDVIQGGAALRRVVPGELRAHLGIPPDAHVVLWLPTWRERGDAAWLPSLDAGTLDAALAGTTALLLVKTHPYSDIDVYHQRLPQHPRIRLLQETQVDVNALLTVADTLVSDYSSTIFDYALLRRPIHFFAPDADDYRGGRGLYEPYEHLTGGRHHATWASLLDAVASSSRGEEGEGLTLMRRVAELAGNNDAPGSSERIVQAVRGAVGLR